MIGAARQFFDRAKAGVSNSVDLTGMSAWLEQNTAHPKILGAPWSFEHHEMQKGIADDPRLHVVVRKCSQVGLSELSVRMCLAILSIYSGHTAIYTLPTANYARKFTRARFDPVISASSYLREQVPSGNDSSELKQIGHSFLYIVGTSGQSAPISIPADVLIRDEVDFSNQAILTKFYSRLGHAIDGGIIRDFSTPTVGGYGISELYDTSSQARYMIHHSACGQKVAPDFMTDVVIPGYDDQVINLDKSDLENPQYDFEAAQLLCPHCRQPISTADLLDVEKREWVEQIPSSEIGGYQIKPFDVPFVNSIVKSLRAIKNYDSKSDWVNFEMGLPYEDAENSFVKEVVEHCSVISPVLPRPLAASGCVAGLDIGKVSHLIIGKREGGKLRVIRYEQIRQNDENNLFKTVQERLKQYGIHKLVVDASPDFTTATQLIGANPVNKVYACYYVRSNKTAFSNYDVKDEEQIINANKVRCFDTTVKKTNSGKILFPHETDKGLVMSHLSAMKRVSRQTASGDIVKAWINTGPDHYAHALNYLVMADNLCDYVSSHAVTATLPHMGRVQFGGAHPQPRTEKLIR